MIRRRLLFLLLSALFLQPSSCKNIIVPFSHASKHKQKDYRDTQQHQVMNMHKHSSSSNIGGGYIDGKYYTAQDMKQILAYCSAHYTAANGPAYKPHNVVVAPAQKPKPKNKQALRQTEDNQSQRMLRQEFGNIVSHAEALRNATSNQELQSMTLHVVEFSGIGTRYLEKGFVQEALLLRNFCWSMLDCCVAFAEGVAQGAKNVGSIVVHPVETVKNLAEAVAHAGRCLGNVLKIVITEQDLCVTDRQEFARRWRQRGDTLDCVISALKNKWHSTPARDMVKGVATVGTEMVLMNQLAAVTGQFLTGARKQAMQAARVLEREGEVVSVMTAEGVAVDVRVAKEATMQFFEGVAIAEGEGLAVASNLQNKFKCYIQGVEEILPEVAQLNANDINHILAAKHEWVRLVHGEQDWDSVARIISKVMREGIEEVQKNGISYKTRLGIGGETVEVTFFKFPDGRKKVSNGWVKT